MKATKLLALVVGSALATQLVHAQGRFQDLNFEEANPVIDPGGEFYPDDVTAASALPGWSVFLGAVQQTDVLQNTFTTGQASVDIFGPNYPAAGPGPGVIDGNYSVLLQSGGDPSGNGTLVNASIAQYATVPSTAQSLEFKAWPPPPLTTFSVSFDGNTLSPVMLGMAANYILFGVNIAPYAGDPGTLEFTSIFTGLGESELGLDDIMFSPNAVPEPSIVVMSAIGGLLFGARKWFARRC